MKLIRIDNTKIDISPLSGRAFCPIFLIILSTLMCLPIGEKLSLFPIEKVMAQTEPNRDTNVEEKTTLKIGILAKRGNEKAIEQWQPTADYLSEKIPGFSFEIVPFDFEEIYTAVENSELDFVITNPGMYTDFEGLYGVYRIATLKNLRLGKSYTVFGGVIFRRADRNDIQELKDVKGKTVMAVDDNAFGGWQMQWKELKDAGINPFKDLKELSFGGTHDNVVYAVRDGEVDVGIIRTDTLERMANEGKINIDDFTILNQKTELQKEFPFVLSTALYPEWAFAATKTTDNELSEKISVALLSMPKDSEAAKASQSEGWTIPLNYRPVDDLFLELQIGRYANLRKLTFQDFIKQNWYWFVISFVSLILVVGAIIIYQQKQTETALKISAEKQKEIIEEQKRTEAELKIITEEKKQQAEILEKGIYQLLDELEGAMDGDLTVRANLTSMEMSTVADLFNAIIDNLNDIAIQVKKSSTQVGLSLDEDKKAIQSLAQQAITEAEETRKTLESVKQMSDSIQEVAENANIASNLANNAYSVTQEGTNAINETENSILSLRMTVGDTAKKMKLLGESSQKISQVVSLIDEIALKTNLLAINASVEASRAGDLGEGFTVIAEQVGALAEQSSTATKEIEQIVKQIQLETQEVTEAMELGTSQVVETTRLVESTKKRLEQILDRSQSINNLMQSISEATISQTDISALVSKLMQQIALNSEQRLEFSQQVSKSMQATTQIAQELESVVAQFKVKEE